MVELRTQHATNNNNHNTQIQTLSVSDEGYSRNVPDEGYSRNVPDEGYSRNVPDEGYSRNVPDEGYSRNDICLSEENLSFDSNCIIYCSRCP
jgi:hypothetical protein